VAELHPVIAWQVDDSWSVGGGLRYVYGSMRTGDNGILPFTTSAGTVPVEVQRDAQADIDGYGWDLALHYARPSWGWGAVLRSSVSLDGSGDADYRARDVPPGVPDLPGQISARLAGGSVSQSFELPYELRGGIWWAPYPELRLEGDASYQRWSGLDDSNATFNPDAFGDGPTVVRRRGWDDTLSLRLGLEGEITEAFWLSAGLAWEPSPVPTSTIEPGFPRGDATVYSAGFSYNFPKLSFDVGYSLHDHDSRSAPRQEVLNPRAEGRYSATDQVWAASVRWRY
jgi:long-chain fatty acid transport protein